MSQVPSQAPDPGWITLPLVKFSYNTSPQGVRGFSWSHILGNDISVVFAEYSNLRTRTVLKVTTATELLETQDLTELVELFRNCDPISSPELPIDVVIKSPFIAMRYPKSFDTVRRIQLKFHNHFDFTRASTLLRNLGLPVTDKLVPGLPPPSPAPTVSSISSASSLGSSINRPSSMSPVKTFKEVPKRHSASSLDSGFKVPLRPNSTQSESQFRNSTIHGCSFAAGTTRPKPALFNLSTFTGASPASRLSSSREPLNQGAYFHYPENEREAQSRRLSYSVAIIPSQFEHKPQPSLSMSQMSTQTAAQISSQRDIEYDRDQDKPFETASPFFPPAGNFQPMNTPARHIMSETQGMDTQRPFSAPMVAADVDNLWIPPRRELPFKKPDQLRKPSTNTLDLPPLPKPTVVKPVDSSTTTSSSVKEAAAPITKAAPVMRIAQRKGPVNKQKEEQATSQRADSILQEPKVTQSPAEEVQISPPIAKSAVATATVRPASAAAVLVSKAAPPAKKRAPSSRPSSANKRRKMVDGSTQTQKLPDDPLLCAQQAVSTVNVPNLIADTPSPPTPPTPAPPAVPQPQSSPPPPPETFLDNLDAFVTKHKARPASKEVWEAPAYSESNDEQRQSMIDEFICENLNNDDFILLCKDTEKSWRRIGLGM